jgi:hypothetical protein
MLLGAPRYPRLLALLNVRVLLSYQALEQAGFRLGRAFDFTRRGLGPEAPAQLRLYEWSEPLGSAFLARAESLGRKAGGDPVETLSRLISPTFDWRSRVLTVEANPYADMGPAPDLIDEVETLERGYGRWRFRVATPQAAVLVLTQSYYPGWRAEVDGAPRPTFPADWALTGVFLEPGRHDVVFRYLPRPFIRGLATTLASAALLALLALALRFHGGRGSVSGVDCQGRNSATPSLFG